jgi:hypothetical protein
MLAQIHVWIECPSCGSSQKLDRQDFLPFDEVTPVIVRTGAICNQCHSLAMMYFERKPVRLH